MRRLQLVWLAVGCQGAGDRPVGPVAPVEHPPTWAEVAPILERCVACHDHSGLTYPMTEWAEAAPLSSVIHEVTRTRRMPPWPAAPADVSYLGDPTLTDEEIAVLAAWDEAGAPLGDADRDLVPPTLPHLPRVDATLSMPGPYVPAAGVDDHRCFVLDRSGITDGWVTGVEAVPGERAEVHHLLVHATTARGPNDPLALDEADPGPGYACPDGLAGNKSLLAGWLPGRGPTLLPAGRGLALAPDARIVLEIHYFGPATGGLPDQTSVRLMTEPSVEVPAEYVTITDPDWRARSGVAVAAGETVTWAVTVGADEILDDAALDGLTAWWVVPHMHEVGVSFTLDLLRDGATTRLVDIPAWDFDWQLQYTFADPVALLPTDEVHLTCTYENPGETDVLWGTGSTEEMCLARLLASG